MGQVNCDESAFKTGFAESALINKKKSFGDTSSGIAWREGIWVLLPQEKKQVNRKRKQIFFTNQIYPKDHHLSLNVQYDFPFRPYNGCINPFYNLL